MMTGSTPPCVEILSPAKVNLFLELFAKRPDGFHELKTIMAEVDLRDHLRFYRRSDDQVNLRIVNQTSETIDIPTDDKNLIVKALKLLRQTRESVAQESEFDKGRLACDILGCDVLLLKKIPSEAGLGGASSNAAAALAAGNSLWDLGLDREQLAALGSQIGSDVPFFLDGGTAICSGRGEVINPIRSHAAIPIVIAKPKSGLSTAKVFGKCSVPGSPKLEETVVSGLGKGNFHSMVSGFFNRLEETAWEMNPEIERLSNEFRKVNCPGHQMSGSGTSYFGAFQTMRSARVAAQALSNRLPETKIFVCRTLSSQLSMVA